MLPILSDYCFTCHGPDQNHRKGDLRLDTQEGALRTDNPVIVPGRSADSELLSRIVSTDPNEVMPPAKSNRRLTAAQIDVLRRWIDEGAAWGRHWAYEPPARPQPPEVKLAGWARNPIDRFILARLEREVRAADGLPDSLRAGRLLSAVYRVVPPTRTGGRQGIALRLMVDPRHVADAPHDDARAALQLVQPPQGPDVPQAGEGPSRFLGFFLSRCARSFGSSRNSG